MKVRESKIFEKMALFCITGLPETSDLMKKFVFVEFFYVKVEKLLIESFLKNLNIVVLERASSNFFKIQYKILFMTFAHFEELRKKFFPAGISFD